MPVPPPKVKKHPEQMTEQELLAGIYRAVTTIRTFVVIFGLLSMFGGLMMIAAVGETAN